MNIMSVTYYQWLSEIYTVVNFIVRSLPYIFCPNVNSQSDFSRALSHMRPVLRKIGDIFYKLIWPESHLLYIHDIDRCNAKSDKRILRAMFFVSSLASSCIQHYLFLWDLYLDSSWFGQEWSQVPGYMPILASFP